MIKSKLLESLKSILPIALIVLGLSITVTPIPAGDMMLFLIGIAFLVFGMSLFNMGAEMSMLQLGVKIGTDGKCVGAGGCIMQALPGATENSLFMAEDTILRMDNISTLVEEKSLEDIADYFFGDLQFNETNPEYKCLCSKDYIESLLISMGKAELDQIIKEQGEISVNCQFCETDYKFNADDVDKLFSK